MIKCFGYIKNDAESSLSEFSEVTFQSNANNLRLLASFLSKCADEIDNNPNWEHEHFKDSLPFDEAQAEIIVYKASD